MPLPIENQYDAMGNYTGLPVEQPNTPVQMPSTTSAVVDKVVNALFRDDDKRLQLWPERLVRDAISAPNEVMTGKISRWSIDPETGELRTSPQMVKAAMDVSALAGTGGLGGADATLGATPFLRPALKYKDKIYKGKPGQEHLDVLPPELVPEFQRLAMSGEDISHYNFGFLNHKGHFLDRESALKYAIDEGLMSPHDAKFGALTSTMMSNNNAGLAVKLGGVDPIHFKSPEAAQFRLGQLQRDKAASKKAGDDVNSSDYMFYNTQIRALKEYLKNPEEFTSTMFADSSKEAAAIKANQPRWQIKGFEDYNDWFHGTTHEFDKFKLSNNKEAYLGQNPHFTNSPKDASANYAGHGPDLTQRIELRAEEIAQKIADKKYGGEMGDNYGKIMTAAKEKAREELAGPHEGAIIPVNLKLENPISIVEHRSTWLDFNPIYDKAGEFVKESPLAIKFYKSLQKQAKKYDLDPDKVMAGMADHMYDEVKASTFDKALRKNEALIYAEDRKTGKLVSSDIIANIYKDMGFDGIVMDAKAAFPRMKDIPDGTLHAAPLKRNTVQSKITGDTLYSNPSVGSWIVNSNGELEKQ